MAMEMGREGKGRRAGERVKMDGWMDGRMDGWEVNE